MQIGPWHCSAVLSKEFKLDGGAMFGVVPKTLWKRVYPADEQNRISMVTRLLLLQGPQMNILVDSGTGERWDDKQRSIYAISEEDRLDKTLADKGLVVEDIDLVIHSHLHFDHCGGSVIENEDGQLIPRFPNAEYMVHKKHFEWALSPSPRDRASFRSEDFLCLQKAGQLVLLEKDPELDHISLLFAHGHTPYQLLPLISDKDRQMLYGGDLFPLAAQVRIPWVMAYDLNPLQTVKEKQEILGQLLKMDSYILFEHDKDVEAARIRQGDKAPEISTTLRLDES